MIKIAFPLLVVACIAAGAPAQSKWPDPRVVCLTSGGTGSFVCAGGTVKIISCAHGGKYVGQRLKFVCNDDSPGVATVEVVDQRADVSILGLSGQLCSSIRPFAVAPQPPRPGEQVYVCGFPGMQGFRCRVTTVRGDMGPTMMLNGSATPGESGGPIINTRGELVGTLCGYTPDRMTICSGWRAVASLCQARPNCPSGACPLPPTAGQLPYPIGPYPDQGLPPGFTPIPPSAGQLPVEVPPFAGQLPVLPPVSPAPPGYPPVAGQLPVEPRLLPRLIQGQQPGTSAYIVVVSGPYDYVPPPTVPVATPILRQELVLGERY